MTKQKLSPPTNAARPDHCGAYRVIHTAGGHFFIGVSSGLRRYKMQAMGNLARGKFTNKPMQALFNIDRRVTIETQFTDTIEEAIQLKQAWLNEAVDKTPALLLNVSLNARLGAKNDGHIRDRKKVRAMREKVDRQPVQINSDDTVPRHLHYGKAVVVEGIEYFSIHALARALHLDAVTIYKRLLSDSERWAYWNFKDPECISHLLTSSTSHSQPTASTMQL